MPSQPQRGILEPHYTPHPGSLWIDAHRSSLPDNVWVAANQNGKVASDSSFDHLMKQIRARDIDPADVAIAFISRDPI